MAANHPKTEVQPDEGPVTWLLVADAAKAEIFQPTAVDGGIHTVYAAESELARKKNAASTTDRPGRFNDGKQAGSHAAGPSSEPQAHEQERFLADVIEGLNAAAKADAFDRLIVVAPPKVLGILRGGIHKTVADRIVGVVAKDLTQMDPREILAREDVPAKPARPPRNPVHGNQNRPG